MYNIMKTVFRETTTYTTITVKLSIFLKYNYLSYQNNKKSYDFDNVIPQALWNIDNSITNSELRRTI